MLIVVYAECHFAEWRNAEGYNAECRGAARKPCHGQTLKLIINLCKLGP